MMLRHDGEMPMFCGYFRQLSVLFWLQRRRYHQEGVG